MLTHKSFFTVAILGIISILVTHTTFADTQITSTYCKPGFYAGLQGGRSDTFYASNDLLTQAALNGTGANIETGNNGTPILTSSPAPITQTVVTTSSTELTAQKVDDIGLGGRIYAGYQFNPYFALETGFTQYAKTTFHATGITPSTTTTTSEFINAKNSSGIPIYSTTTHNTVTTNYFGEVTERAIDLVAKGTLPLEWGFGLYAKAGVAYISADRDINSNTAPGSEISSQNSLPPGIASNKAAPINAESITTTNIDTNNYNTLYTKSYQAFRPIGGIGINYTIPATNFSIDGSYTRIFSYGAIPNASLLALGLEYKFA